MTTLLVQLSDTHILAPGRLAYGRVDTAACLERAVGTVLRLPQPPDAVVVTGDLVDGGGAREYDHLRALLATLPCPFYLLPGNHDDPAQLRASFPDHAYLRQADAPFVQYAVDLAGLRLVALDTTVPRAPHGELDDARLAWLDGALAAAPRTPTIVAMHHPPFPTFIGHMDEMGLRRGAGELAAIVARHPQVERIVCGHLHRSIQSRYAGTLAMTAPSTAHQMAFDLGPDAPVEFTMEPPGVVVHAWAPGRSVVSHLVPTGEHDGPFPFHD